MPRAATIDDVAELVRLRSVMFEEMGVDTSGAWPDLAADWFASAIAAPERFVASVVDDSSDRLTACAVAEVLDSIPYPANPTGVRAHVSTVVTDVGHRRAGHATAVMKHLLAGIAALGITQIELNAVPNATPIYERLGFTHRSGGTRMLLDSSTGESSCRVT